MTVGGEGGSKKNVDGRRGERFESKNVEVLLLTVEGEGGLNKTKLLTVVDGREGGWVINFKNVDGC